MYGESGSARPFMVENAVVGVDVDTTVARIASSSAKARIHLGAVRASYAIQIAAPAKPNVSVRTNDPLLQI